MKAQSVVDLESFEKGDDIDDETMKKVLDHERLTHMMQLAKERA